MNNALLKIKHFLKGKIFICPYLHLIYGLFSAYYRLKCGDTDITGNLLGFSILVNVQLFFLYWFTSNYCWLTRFAVLGMFAINFICLTKFIFSLEFYTFWYQLLINSIVIFISIIFKIRKL